jgi:hypothetical protein
VAKVETIMDKLGQEIETQKEIQNAISTDMVGTGVDDVRSSHWAFFPVLIP